MEKFWLFLLYIGLVQGSSIPHHHHYQQYHYLGNQKSHGNNVLTISDLASILKEKIGSLQKIPGLVSTLEESTKNLERIPDLATSLERISGLEKVLKDMSESLQYGEVQESIESLELKVQTLASNLESLEQKVQTLQSNPGFKFSQRSGSDACFQDKVVGQCKAAFPRFYYDVNTNTCKSFLYGGCDGNDNNFEKQSECESLCVNPPLSSSARSNPDPTPTSMFSSRSGVSDSSQSSLDSDCLCGLAKRGGSAKRAPPSLGIDVMIVGGVETEVNEYPWQVFISITTKSSSSIFRCGGSVISNRWIISAAHCFAEGRGVEDLSSVTVTLGDHDITTESESDSLTRDVPLNNIYVHPWYRHNNGVQNHDYALIQLDFTIDWATYPNIRPICLPALPFSEFNKAIASGWGMTIPEVPSFPDKLQEVEIRVISNAECNNIYGGVITDVMICAGNQEESKDACSGDSGGPLIAAEPGQNYELFGISSFGPGCGTVGRPGVYSRVSEVISWIEQRTGIISDGCPRN